MTLITLTLAPSFFAACAMLVPVPLRAACISATPSTPPPTPLPGLSPAPASPEPSPTASQAPLYPMNDDIYTIDRDVTLFYYFQGNRDGTAKVKKEFRYDRNLWDTCAQVQIRLPVITRYPTSPKPPYSPDANPYSGFGNAELRYLYSVTSKTFDHTITVGAAFPTQTNGVESIDTQLKFFYVTKWKWDGGAIASTNEYDQTIIRPPGSSYTSYYEQEISLPYWSFVDNPDWKSLKLSATYTGRVLFDTGSIYKSALGFVVNGSIIGVRGVPVALSLRDTWGIGGNGVWKYKVEANAAARF